MHLLSIKGQRQWEPPVVLWSGHQACVLTICQCPVHFLTLIRILNSEAAVCSTLDSMVSRTGTNTANLVLIKWFTTFPCCSPSAHRSAPISMPGHISHSPHCPATHSNQLVKVSKPGWRGFFGHIKTDTCPSVELCQDLKQGNLSNSPNHGDFENSCSIAALITCQQKEK